MTNSSDPRQLEPLSPGFPFKRVPLGQPARNTALTVTDDADLAPSEYDPAAFRWVPVRRVPRCNGWTEEKPRHFTQVLADTCMAVDSITIPPLRHLQRLLLALAGRAVHHPLVPADPPRPPA